MWLHLNLLLEKASRRWIQNVLDLLQMSTSLRYHLKVRHTRTHIHSATHINHEHLALNSSEAATLSDSWEVAIQKVYLDPIGVCAYSNWLIQMLRISYTRCVRTEVYTVDNMPDSLLHALSTQVPVKSLYSWSTDVVNEIKQRNPSLKDTTFVLPKNTDRPFPVIGATLIGYLPTTNSVLSICNCLFSSSPQGRPAVPRTLLWTELWIAPWSSSHLFTLEVWRL